MPSHAVALRIGFHEARHTYASLMIAAGDNVKAISTYMGHASVKIPLHRYGHLMPNSTHESAARLDDYLAPRASRAPVKHPDERLQAASSGSGVDAQVAALPLSDAGFGPVTGEGA